jgi:hypothetical protein
MIETEFFIPYLNATHSYPLYDNNEVILPIEIGSHENK